MRVGMIELIDQAVSVVVAFPADTIAVWAPAY